MACITVVDDSQVDRMLIGGLLRTNSKYRVGLASNGKDALARIADAPPHLVITDLVMPEMDGFELVKELRFRYPQIPVILMTAYGNESIAVQALEAGAASYVPKAQQAERLHETVERVLAKAETERRRARFAECVSEFHCTYLLGNDPDLIAPLIDDIQQRLVGVCIDNANERLRTALALEEAILNAMYHGNLEVSETEAAHARANPDFLRFLVEQRRASPAYRKRQIRVEAHITGEGARFVIHDDGPGFDISAASAASDGECFESGRGRGLMLIRSHMNKVSYNRIGNEVTLVKHTN